MEQEHGCRPLLGPWSSRARPERVLRTYWPGEKMESADRRGLRTERAWNLPKVTARWAQCRAVTGFLPFPAVPSGSVSPLPKGGLFLDGAQASVVPETPARLGDIDHVWKGLTTCPDPQS